MVDTPGDFPPFTATTSTDQLIGLDIDLARNLAGWLQEKWFKCNDWMKELPDLDFFRELEKPK